MTNGTFDAHCRDLATRRSEIVNAKRPEYTEGNEDVLFNFKSTAREVNVTPEQVCYIFFRKHVASIAKYCGGTTVTAEPIQDRICDAINYLELLNAIIKETMKPKLNLLSMEELSRIVRHPGIDEPVRDAALDELYKREKTKWPNRFTRFNYATI